MSEEQNVQPCKKQKMKVYYGHYCNRYSNVRHPVIRLKGNYLSTLGGFAVGDYLEVSVTKGEIIIKKILID